MEAVVLLDSVDCVGALDGEPPSACEQEVRSNVAMKSKAIFSYVYFGMTHKA